MPLEGHFRRVNTPLRQLTPRERNVIVAGLVVMLATLAAILLATAGDSRPVTTAPGCIHVVSGRTGGEVVAACGAEAKATCARSASFHDPRAEEVTEHCRMAGIETGAPAGGGTGGG